MPSLKRILFYSFIVAFASLLAIITYEFLIRQTLISHYRNNATPLFLRNESLSYNSLSDKYFDVKIPSNYPKTSPFKINTQIDTAMIDKNRKIVFYASANTNNLGFLSDKTYFYKKNKNEYRIAILGDSMTGGTTANQHWVDLVEDLLNHKYIQEQLDTKKKFKVYNLGVPGAGFKEFWKFYNLNKNLFNFDYVVVNFLENNIERATYHFQNDENDSLKNWISLSENYAHKIVNNSKKVLFTLQPLYNELTNQKEYTYFYDFRKNLKNYNFLVMKDKFKKEELDDSEFYTWFNLPWDGHMSLKGGTIYAREITKVILNDAFSIKIKDFPLTSFEKDRFKNYKKNLELYKGNKINIGNKEYYLDDLVNIRTKITKEYLLGKRFEFKLYGIDNILGKKLYYTDYPSYKLMDMHAVPFDIGVNSRKGLLQMHCIKNSRYTPKISNPDCFHGYIVMLGSYE